MTRRSFMAGTKRDPFCRQGFSLVEMLVSMGVFSLIVVVMAYLMSMVQTSYVKVNDRVEKFRAARQAFTIIANRVEQATLNTYWAYDDPVWPTRYLRQSELHFVSGPVRDLVENQNQWKTSGQALFFQAPLGIGMQRGQADDPLRGMESLLNGWGFFLAYGDDRPFRPPFLRNSEPVALRQRWRLMEFSQPTERLRVYEDDLAHSRGGRGEYYRWFREDLEDYTRPLAENIVVLVFRSRNRAEAGDPAQGTEIAPQYLYDSKELRWNGETSLTGRTYNQLPPMVEITMIAISEAAAIRYESIHGEGSLAGVIPDTYFQNSADFEKDLSAVEKLLAGEGIDFQTFSTTVVVRAAKWSL